METLKQHFVHHRLHMLGCAGGALVSVVGGVLDSPIVAIGGAIVCGAFCLDMIRMMVVMRPKRG